MSTLKCDSLQNTAGTKTIPVNTVVDGSAKAWVNFNGTGTVAIQAAFNVSSITDNGVGWYTINFATAIADANYAWVGVARNPAASTTNRTCVDQNTSGSKTASELMFRVMSGGNSAYMSDSDDISIAVFR